MMARSFRFQIVLWSVLVSGVVLLSFGMVAWWSLNRDRLESLDESLTAFGFRHATRVSRNVDSNKLELSLIEQFGEDAGQTRFVALIDKNGKDVFRSPRAPDSMDASDFPGGTVPLAPQPTATKPPKLNARDQHGKVREVMEPRFYTASLNDHQYRIGVFSNREVRLIVGADLQELEDEIGALRRAFLLALPGALLLVAIGAWLIARRALRPVHALERNMKHISAQELNSRLEVSRADSEFAEIIKQYNEMLERLERSFHQATRFSADASHELKTPLAIMRGTLERALAQAQDPGQQAACSDLLEQTDRQKAILENLLLLSRADSGHLILSSEPVNFSEALETWLEDASFLAEERDISISSEVAPGLMISGDLTLLQQVAHNLFSNAVRHNENGGEISCSLYSEDAQIVWEVTNTGPLIADDESETIFGRFQRGSATQGNGTGLGLSLVKEIVSAHGGSITATSRNERNLFRITLPNISSA